MKKFHLIVFIISIALGLQAQNDSPKNRFISLRSELVLNLTENPGLEEPVDLSVSKAPLAEFIRALGINNKVNLSVDPDLSGFVSNTFSSVTVMDVLLFLCEQYQLDLKFTGGIIHVLPYQAPKPPPQVTIPKSLPLFFDADSNTVSIDLQGDSLSKVAKEMTNVFGVNVVYEPGIGSKRIDFYANNISLDQAMEKIGFANNLQIEKTEDNFYLISAVRKPKDNGSINRSSNFKVPRNGNYEIALDSGYISIEAYSASLANVLFQVLDAYQLNYFLFSPLDGEVNMNVKNLSLEQFFSEIFKETSYTYRLKDSLYLFGTRDQKGVLDSRNIPFKNRTVDGQLQYVPAHLKSGLEIKEDLEMNSFLVSGPYPLVEELKAFVTLIDQVVPVVLIEVIIVDYQRTYNVASGVDVGVGGNAPASGGSVFPGLDYTLNANSLNQIIQSFNGFGSLNLGPVTPNFYVNLQLLESNGILNVRSTPKLSTLNGHEATISIGNTEYYVVEQVNIQGVQNPIPITTRNYQSVQANFSLKILPMVSSDNQVTLIIDVEQSDFTGRIAPEAPPGSVSRKFSSVIRVHNQEVILLGGLEEKSSEDSGSGVPIISRIPVLRWFFSSRNRVDSKSRLSVFIKPTIIQ